MAALLSSSAEKYSIGDTCMNRKEISEIRKQLTPERCTITRICGCYVDGEKEKKADFKQAFLALPEEEIFFDSGE